MSTTMEVSEVRAIKRARKLYPDISKTELAERIRKASRLGRGRPPAELAGLAPLAKEIDNGRTVGSLVRAM